MSYLIFMFLTRQCLGVSSLSALESRIVKGYKVEIYQYPHSVFLHFQTSVPTACGSTLITNQAVVTAAHCLDEVKYKDGKITAFLGATIPMKSDIKRYVVLYTIHKRFQPHTGKFNLGIALFHKPVELSTVVQKIPIITKLPKINEALYTSGWGKQNPFTMPDYSDMRHLKVSKQRVLSEQECQKYTKTKKTPAFWCTSSINGYHYHGDIGNGMVTSYKSLVGVVSFMINDVTIYSDVIREQLWINNTIMNLLDHYCRAKKRYINNISTHKKIG